MKISGRRRGGGVCPWITLTFLASASWALSASLTAELDREMVPLGETVTLSLVFEGASPSGTPVLPALPGLNVVGNRHSSQMSITPEGQSVKNTFQYVLMTTKIGLAMIPPMQVQVGGETLTSQPLRLKVVAKTGGADAGGQTNLAFLKLVVPKNEVYLGEPFVIEMQLYFRDAQDIRMPQLSAEGFSMGASAQPAQTTTAVGGVGYNLVTFKSSGVAAKIGELTLGPATCEMNLRVPLNTRQRDPFDPFGDFFGRRVQLKPATLNSDAIQMRVLPLPAQNVPPTFNGAVGQFQMTVSAGPTNLAVGDPITVRVRIAGRGFLDRIALAAQPDWRDFKTYPPTSSIETSDPLGLQGAKVFEQVIIPQNHEIKTLPPFQFTYFDPNQKSYRTLTQPAIPLAIRPSVVSATPVLNLTNGTAPAPPTEADDIVHIKARLGRSNGGKALLAQQPWFLPLQIVPVLTWLGLLVWRKRSELLASNPKLRRQRQVSQKVREGVRDLHAQAQKQDSDRFFAALFRLLQEQLGARLDLPASAITEAIIEERLQGGVLPENALAALRELFQACNQARYAPIRSSQELSALIPKAETVLRDLEKLNA